MIKLSDIAKFANFYTQDGVHFTRLDSNSSGWTWCDSLEACHYDRHMAKFRTSELVYTESEYEARHAQ